MEYSPSPMDAQTTEFFFVVIDFIIRYSWCVFIYIRNIACLQKLFKSTFSITHFRFTFYETVHLLMYLRKHFIRKNRKLRKVDIPWKWGNSRKNWMKNQNVIHVTRNIFSFCHIFLFNKFMLGHILDCHRK